MQCGWVSNAFSHCLPPYTNMSNVQPAANSSAPAPPAPSVGKRCCTRRVAVFDFDSTIKLANGNAARDAHWVMQQTWHGYDAAIATASCNTAYVRNYLQNLAPDVWSGARG